MGAHVHTAVSTVHSKKPYLAQKEENLLLIVHEYLVSLGAVEALEPVANIAEGCSRMDHRHEEGRIEVFGSWYHGTTAQQRSIARESSNHEYVTLNDSSASPFVCWGEGCRAVAINSRTTTTPRSKRSV